MASEFDEGDLRTIELFLKNMCVGILELVYRYLVNNPEPVQYYIYAMAFSFDLKCESVTCINIYTIVWK